jgi:hypothetical protein
VIPNGCQEEGCEEEGHEEEGREEEEVTQVFWTWHVLRAPANAGALTLIRGTSAARRAVIAPIVHRRRPHGSRIARVL